VIVQTIAATTTRGGLKVHAELDTATYPTGVKIGDEQMKALGTQGILTRLGGACARRVTSDVEQISANKAGAVAGALRTLDRLTASKWKTSCSETSADVPSPCSAVVRWPIS
jgi:hypothetical protein